MPPLSNANNHAIRSNSAGSHYMGLVNLSHCQSIPNWICNIMLCQLFLRIHLTDKTTNQANAIPSTQDFTFFKLKWIRCFFVVVVVVVTTTLSRSRLQNLKSRKGRGPANSLRAQRERSALCFRYASRRSGTWILMEMLSVFGHICMFLCSVPSAAGGSDGVWR